MKLNEFAEEVDWRLCVAEIDGELWSTDSYWQMRHKGSLAEELLRFWNLEGPGEYHVVRPEPEFDVDNDEPLTTLPPVHVSRIGDVPEKTLAAMAALLKAEPAIPLTVLRPIPGSTSPGMVRQGNSLMVITTRPDGEQTYLSDTKLRIIAGDCWADAEALSLRQTDAPQRGGMAPIWVGTDALVMPMRKSA